MSQLVCCCVLEFQAIRLTRVVPIGHTSRSNSTRSSTLGMLLDFATGGGGTAVYQLFTFDDEEDLCPPAGVSCYCRAGSAQALPSCASFSMVAL